MKAKSSAIGVSQYKNKEFMVTGWLRNSGKHSWRRARVHGRWQIRRMLAFAKCPKEEGPRILTACFFAGRVGLDGWQAKPTRRSPGIGSAAIAIFTNGIRDLQFFS
ncbi:MAG: hypothetical protein DMG34_17110 [Acidobacteria bacterium]|nr:MAG: hypothetical protein DMG34_17110 [Acidobacteriota bacterium]